MLETGMPFTAVLDLKKAYDTVPRDKLMQIVEQKLPKHIANMIAYLLQPTILRTARDNTSKEGKDDNVVRIGVLKGDPPSTTLFNMYMDKYAEQILPHTKHYRNRNYGLIMFADDVKTANSHSTVSPIRTQSIFSVEC
ncbi:hypothetical protein BWQ96_10831 [Gracilariopsis chorda]|uniref:Reverse transcriptase domain-containing protein n=1 Tax=Gracilariopsis chorda TaxID=448386 RepID=A0A2V3IBK4_9FLOR|nr:hypothetical protein BWQ96_10831 [Gracilariopsis chorda]|eukprot:PXF39484.1 hypothetical protein BWQ96_10831 [Gracilariopsis chorda]